WGEGGGGCGEVRVLEQWSCEDRGGLINPLVVEGQIAGAVALGIESALYANVHYDTEGQPLAGTFMDHALPRSSDIPPLHMDHLETPSLLNPLGLKGVGESG